MQTNDVETSRSLIIVALPRSLSTVIYQQACTALGLRQPSWTTAGEILNGDRMVTSAERFGGEAPKYTPPECGYQFEQLLELVDDVVAPSGRIYKDVVQPFVVSQWLRRNDLAILRIRRPLADVAWAMQRLGWWFPEQAAPPSPDRWDRLVRGLRRASEALDALPAEVVEFEELINGEATLRSALERLYPERTLGRIDYLNDAFRERRQRVLRCRQDPLWQELDERFAA